MDHEVTGAAAQQLASGPQAPPDHFGYSPPLSLLLLLNQQRLSLDHPGQPGGTVDKVSDPAPAAQRAVVPAPTPGADSPWMTTAQVAEYLRVSRGTVRNWVSQRRVPFVKRRGVVRFHRDRIDEWLSEGGCKGRHSVADMEARRWRTPVRAGPSASGHSQRLSELPPAGRQG